MRLVVPGETDATEEVGANGRIYSIAGAPAPLNRDYRLISPRAYLRKGSPVREIIREEKPGLAENGEQTRYQSALP